MIRVSVKREYDLTVADLFPDGIPDPPAHLAREWPAGWDDERRAAFLFNEQAERNPFAESSFLKDFETDCARSWMTASIEAETAAEKETSA